MQHEKDAESGQQQPSAKGIGRREFLAMGSLLAVAPWFERLAAAAPEAASEAAAVQKPASLGYLEGSDLIGNLRSLPSDLRKLTVTSRGGTYTAGRRIVPAADLTSGDPALVGLPVRMTVHGLYPPAPSAAIPVAARPRSVDLDVFIPCPEMGLTATARYQAWSYRRLPAENHSARVSFLVWPDWVAVLALTARVVPADPRARPLLLHASFTPGGDPGRPKLLHGVYLLGLTPDAWADEVDLPDNPARVPADLLSVLISLSPEGVRIGNGK